MNGCKKCPAYAKCTETYRGSGCAALRYTYGLESDPKLDCTDRERLIDLLNEVGSNVLQFPTDGFITALADHLLANGVTFAKDTDVPSKWISMAERKPEDDLPPNSKKNECDINIGRWRDDMFCSYWRKKRVDDGK